MPRKEIKELAKEFTDKSRKPRISGKKVAIPLKFDEEGQVLTQENFDIRKHLKMLSLDDLSFLKLWRDSGWNDEEASSKSLLPPDRCKALVRKLVCFKQEEERIKALADIPTPNWITAKHTENVFEGKLDDSQRDSLKELAKITGAYKTNAIGIQINNFLQMPDLTPEQEAKLKSIGDSIASEAIEVADAA